MGLLSLDYYHFHFLMILKETLTFLSLLNAVLQYIMSYYFTVIAETSFAVTDKQNSDLHSWKVIISASVE